MQCKRHRRWGFSPWVRKIPWGRKWEPTPVILPEKIPWTEEPDGLQSKGSQRIRHNYTTKYTHTLTLWLHLSLPVWVPWVDLPPPRKTVHVSWDVSFKIKCQSQSRWTFLRLDYPQGGCQAPPKPTELESTRVEPRNLVHQSFENQQFGLIPSFSKRGNWGPREVNDSPKIQLSQQQDKNCSWQQILRIVKNPSPSQKKKKKPHSPVGLNSAKSLTSPLHGTFSCFSLCRLT